MRSAIGKEIQLDAEGVGPSSCSMRAARLTIGRLSEIDWRTVNKDLCDAVVGSQHHAHRNNSASVASSAGERPSSGNPLGRVTFSVDSEHGASFTGTRFELENSLDDGPSSLSFQ